MRLQSRLLARRLAERAVQRIGGQLHGVSLAGAEAAQLRGDLLSADPRRNEQRRCAHHAHDGAAGGDRGAATARVESGVRDLPLCARGIERQRNPDQIAAGRTARGAGESIVGHVPASARTFEMTAEMLIARVHTSESKGSACVLRLLTWSGVPR